MTARTVVYTPEVYNTPRSVQKAIAFYQDRLKYAVRLVHDGGLGGSDTAARFTTRSARSTELLVVDEADPLKTPSLEQIRDHYDRTSVGVVLIGMPGIEESLGGHPQLYGHVGFVHHYQPLSPVSRATTYWTLRRLADHGLVQHTGETWALAPRALEGLGSSLAASVTGLDAVPAKGWDTVAEQYGTGLAARRKALHAAERAAYQEALNRLAEHRSKAEVRLPSWPVTDGFYGPAASRTANLRHLANHDISPRSRASVRTRNPAGRQPVPGSRRPWPEASSPAGSAPCWCCPCA